MTNDMVIERPDDMTEPLTNAEGESAPATSARTERRSSRRANTWAIVLAGGQGMRLRSFTGAENGGTVVPKQFCRFRDDRTLLGATIDRALQNTSLERVLVVVMEEHRRFWSRELSAIPPENVLSQPLDRGTAVAILRGLVEVLLRDRDSRVVVMPSDHEVDDEAVLVRSIRRAVRSSSLFPNHLVLLGVVPSHLDCDYGLILPQPGTETVSHGVRAFVEKPTLTEAARLVREGALWNSFIFACTGLALYVRFEELQRSMTRACLRAMTLARSRSDSLAGLYRSLSSWDFSRDVLERSPGRLRWVPVPPCGWTDLGTPARLAAWLDRHRDAPFWREHGAARLGGQDGFTLRTGGA
jgi:mannose-1-phosphate guanylyltransferase